MLQNTIFTLSDSSRMKSFALFVLIAFIALPVASQDRERGWSYKQQGRWLDTQASMKGGTAASDCFIDQTTRREAILNGNRITAQILNFGSISSPGNTLTDIVWNGLGYGYEFGPFVAAEVIDIGHKDPKVFSKGMKTANRYLMIKATRSGLCISSPMVSFRMERKCPLIFPRDGAGSLFLVHNR